ncbi:MAG: hypothetical protein V2I50_14685 [Desulfuromusa sp.]|nr:hypothetical protein [Desulfuromusa sp.]
MLNSLLLQISSLKPSGPLKSMFIFGLIFISLLSIAMLSGCADHKAKTQELLAEDFLSLSNDDLILYYYKLEDQIEIVEQKRRGSSISLGLGLGSFGRSSGSSGSVGVTTGGSQRDIATDLRDQRNKVKLELQHRNITP